MGSNKINKYSSVGNDKNYEKKCFVLKGKFLLSILSSFLQVGLFISAIRI